MDACAHIYDAYLRYIDVHGRLMDYAWYCVDESGHLSVGTMHLNVFCLQQPIFRQKMAGGSFFLLTFTPRKTITAGK